MTERYNLDQIRDFWTKQALKHGQSVSASWSDFRVAEMEIREIIGRLSDGDRVLDIGCANGCSTVQYALQKKVIVKGLDFIPEMIEQARLRLSNLRLEPAGQVEFEVGDITALNEPNGVFDKVVVVRVIINLGDWSRQLQALRECSRVLKPGGRLLLSEATLQGWNQLNKFRREWGLPDMPMPSFNLYLDQEQVSQALSQDLELIEIVDFSSTYYVGTRLIKPLLAKLLGGNIDIADPAMEWNRWLAQLPSWGDYGVQKLFVFRKK